MADAPFGAQSYAASNLQEPKTQVGRFVGSSWTLARRSNCFHGRAVSTAGCVIPFKFRLANYRVAAEEQPRRTPGNYQSNYPPSRGKGAP
jgi:hypothetical protein